jgi:hypothetical protein
VAAPVRGMPLNRVVATCGAAATIFGSHLAEACGTSIRSMEMARIDPDLLSRLIYPCVFN